MDVIAKTVVLNLIRATTLRMDATIEKKWRIPPDPCLGNLVNWGWNAGCRRALMRWRDRIANANFAAHEHTRGDPAVAAHRCVAAGTQSFLHARAGVACARRFENRAPDAKAPVLERGKVDTGDDQVAA